MLKEGALLVLTASGAATLPNGDALGLLLSAQGFLLAAVALAVSLGAPAQVRQLRYRMLKPSRIMNFAVALMALLSVGAVAAWWGLLSTGAFRHLQGLSIGVSLMAAILGMPLVALGLVLGAKRG